MVLEVDPSPTAATDSGHHHRRDHGGPALQVMKVPWPVRVIPAVAYRVWFTPPPGSPPSRDPDPGFEPMTVTRPDQGSGPAPVSLRGTSPPFGVAPSPG